MQTRGHPRPRTSRNSPLQDKPLTSPRGVTWCGVGQGAWWRPPGFRAPGSPSPWSEFSSALAPVTKKFRATHSLPSSLCPRSEKPIPLTDLSSMSSPTLLF
ncbi:hypothetical protein B0T16DRAFT_225937 [Cercophora newfieldiana]|uniref:Uncharacterized protein n=1 Tax=Cercophora newfieldiana TaxID=92897 RepID=A0AA39XZ39_9PEZI|nr:hypothetical protein B0T16DRAFT_225937 [Cercophora newfieldiana]